MLHQGFKLPLLATVFLYLSLFLPIQVLTAESKEQSFGDGLESSGARLERNMDAEYGGPRKEILCQTCHPKEDDSQTLPSTVAPVGPPDPESWVVRFAHAPHEDVTCLTCHKDVSEAAAGPVQVQACLDCHGEAIESGRCRDCHEKDRFFPTNHKPAGKWRKRHGFRANVLVFPDRREWNRVKTGHAYDCSSCHVDDQCRKCHQFTRPDSHTGFWRIRGHGIRAVAERESCAVCHVEAFCIRCHKNTKPINHVGNWSSVHGRAVATGQAERCWVCHPRVIYRVRVGNRPECNICHPP